MRRVTGSGSGSGEQNDGGGEVHKINYYIVFDDIFASRKPGRRTLCGEFESVFAL
jgi:hypothetical protein